MIGCTGSPAPGIDRSGKDIGRSAVSLAPGGSRLRENKLLLENWILGSWPSLPASLPQVSVAHVFGGSRAWMPQRYEAIRRVPSRHALLPDSSRSNAHSYSVSSITKGLSRYTQPAVRGRVALAHSKGVTITGFRAPATLGEETG